jgi:hypothetical protein
VHQIFERDVGVVAITGDGQCRVFSSRNGDVIWDEVLPWKDVSFSQGEDDDEFPPEMPIIHLAGAVLVGSKADTLWRISEFWARNLVTGNPGWRYRPPRQATAYCVSVPYLLYFTDELEEDDSEPGLVILQVNEDDASDPPEEISRIQIPRVFSPEEIAVHDQTLYGCDSGDVFSYDLESDKLNWLKSLDASRLLVIEETLLFVVAGFDKLVALDTVNG